MMKADKLAGIWLFFSVIGIITHLAMDVGIEWVFFTLTISSIWQGVSMILNEIKPSIK